MVVEVEEVEAGEEMGLIFLLEAEVEVKRPRMSVEMGTETETGMEMETETEMVMVVVDEIESAVIAATVITALTVVMRDGNANANAVGDEDEDATIAIETDSVWSKKSKRASSLRPQSVKSGCLLTERNWILESVAVVVVGFFSDLFCAFDYFRSES